MSGEYWRQIQAAGQAQAQQEAKRKTEELARKNQEKMASAARDREHEEWFEKRRRMYDESSRKLAAIFKDIMGNNPEIKHSPAHEVTIHHDSPYADQSSVILRWGRSLKYSDMEQDFLDKYYAANRGFFDGNGLRMHRFTIPKYQVPNPVFLIDYYWIGGLIKGMEEQYNSVDPEYKYILILNPGGKSDSPHQLGYRFDFGYDITDFLADPSIIVPDLAAMFSSPKQHGKHVYETRSKENHFGFEVYEPPTPDRM